MSERTLDIKTIARDVASLLANHVWYYDGPDDHQGRRATVTRVAQVVDFSATTRTVALVTDDGTVARLTIELAAPGSHGFQKASTETQGNS